MGRKILIGFLTLIVLLGIGYAIVRPRIPEWTVEFVLNRMEQDEYAMIFESEEFDIDEDQEVLLRKFLETLSYEVKGSRIEGDEAYVTVDLTFMDIEQLVIENRQTLIENALGNLGGILGHFFSGRTEALASELFLELLEDESLVIPLKTKEVEVLLERSGLLWAPVITEEWLESIFELNQIQSSFEKLLR